MSSADTPLARPSTKPIEPPMAKPARARAVLTPMFWMSSPDCSSRQNASATAVGAGSTFGAITPAREATSQAEDDQRRQQPADAVTSDRPNITASVAPLTAAFALCPGDCIGSALMRPPAVGERRDGRPRTRWRSCRPPAGATSPARASGTEARRRGRPPQDAGSRSR